MSDLKVALVQMGVVDGDPGENLERATSLLLGAAGADVYVLPELWTTGYATATWRQAASRDTPRITLALVGLAARLRAFIVGSMVSENDAGRLANRLWVFGPKGAAVATYDKGHLFAPMDEDRHLVAGAGRAQVAMHDWTAGLSLCFDLRFPEMYRLDALAGADLFLVPAEWPAPRADALSVLARARAIENQAYLVLCNRLGVAADGTEFGGGSMLIAPDGTVVADAGTREGVVLGVARRAELERVRAQGSLLGLRRKGLDW
jgi:omega-amidase